MIRPILSLIRAVVLIAVLLGVSAVVPGPAAAQSGGEVPGNASGNVGNAELWRQIRQGAPGQVSIPDPFAGTMIRSSGEDWRIIRSKWLPYYGAIPLIAALVLTLLFYLIRGRIKIEGGRSGRTIQRFKLSHRTMHWFVACLFILLSISGLVLLFGRKALIPLIGKDAISAIASASLQGHNLFGPIFAIVFVPMIFFFLKGNGFSTVDLKWLARAGGLFGGHAPSGKNNFGEKSWYWLLVLGGTVLCVSGLLLDFPWLAAKIQYLNIAQIAHAVSAIVLITVAIGHIYIGSLGMEGALEGMTKGTVDENWAKQHHDLWAEEVLSKTRKETQTDEAAGDTVPAPAE